MIEVKRIAELEEAVSQAEGTARSAANNAQRRLAEIKERDRRIAELEAELAKSKELPPLPGDIRVIVDTLRQSHLTHDQAVTLAGFIDATFPKPVPQWELDARSVSKMARGYVLTHQDADAIAARIREANRGNSK